MSALEKFPVRNRWTGEVQFTAKIRTTPDTPPSVKLGLAVKWAVKNRANLTGAYLAGANLAWANLTRANLTGADLTRANLTRADLTGANLAGANLTGAYLAGADLACANLARAYLAGANLTGADLAGADLACANLARAYLARANLTGANLTGAKGSKLTIARTRILPEGSLIGWKKCQGGVIVKLRIPEEAKRSHAFGRKCRAEYADVLEVIGVEVGISSHDSKAEYRAGERVTCDKWSDDWQEECAGGIHFYITREEAEAH